MDFDPPPRHQAIQAQPLVRFGQDGAVLELRQEGLNELRRAVPPLRIGSVVGKGRCGKSYVASMLAGFEGAFQTSDRKEAMTEGIDVVAIVEETGTTIVLDVEGFDNALAATRPSLGVLALLMSTTVVSVGFGMLDDSNLALLGVLVAARKLLQGSVVSERPLLHHVVNFCILKGYEVQDLLTALQSKETDMHQAVLQFFDPTSLRDIPFMTPDNKDEIRDRLGAIRSDVRDGPIAHVCGLQLSGTDLELIMKEGVTQLNSTNTIDASSTFSGIVRNAFLNQAAEARKLFEHTFPSVDVGLNYSPKLDEMDADSDIAPIMEHFDSNTEHISATGPRKEVRDELSQALQSIINEAKRKNDILCNEGRAKAGLMATEFKLKYQGELQAMGQGLSIGQEKVKGLEQQYIALVQRFKAAVIDTTRRSYINNLEAELAAFLQKEFESWKAHNQHKKEREHQALESLKQSVTDRFSSGLTVDDYVNDLERRLNGKLQECLAYFDMSSRGVAWDDIIRDVRKELVVLLNKIQCDAIRNNKVLDGKGAAELVTARRVSHGKCARALESGCSFRAMQTSVEQCVHDFGIAASRVKCHPDHRSLELRVLQSSLAQKYHEIVFVSLKQHCTDSVNELLERCLAGDLQHRHAIYQAWFDNVVIGEKYSDWFMRERMQPEERCHELWVPLKQHIVSERDRFRNNVFGAEFVRQQISAAKASETWRRCAHCGIAYCKEAGCDSVRCGFMDYHDVAQSLRGDKVVLPPARGRDGKVHGCGKLFDWNTADNVTDADLQQFFTWHEPASTTLAWLGTATSAVASSLRRWTSWLTGGPAEDAPDSEGRFLKVTGELEEEMRREKGTLSASQREQQWKRLMLQWHPDKSQDPLATRVVQFLTTKKFWYLA